jgi:hypothetical protein
MKIKGGLSRMRKGTSGGGVGDREDNRGKKKTEAYRC